MVWLTTIPVRAFGFSTASGRLTSAVLGVLIMVLIFALALRIAGVRFATVTLGFTALSPWLISDARVAHDGAALAPFFVILILLLWHSTAEGGYALARTAILGAVIGFSANAYQTTRLMGPLLLLLIAMDLIRNRRRIDTAPFILGAAALLGASPQLWVLLTNRERFFARAAETVVSGSSPLDTLLAMLSGLAANFAPRYLFWPDMTEAFLTTARLLPVELLFMPLGLLTLWRMQGWSIPRFRPYLYIALLIAALPAALTNQNPHSLRAASCAVLLPFFSAAGVMALEEWFERRGGWRGLVRIAVPASIAASFCFVAYMYLFSPAAKGLRMQTAIVEAAEKVSPHLARYDRVFISNAGLHPYLYFVAFTGMKPGEFQSAPKEIHSLRGWDVVTRVGKFFFRSDEELATQARMSMSERTRDLFVSRTPLAGGRVIDSVHWHWDRYYIADFP